MARGLRIGYPNPGAYTLTAGMGSISLSGQASDSIIGGGDSGDLDHGSSFSITSADVGTSLGTKSTAAPAVWDNCTGTMSSLWDLTVPNSATNSANDMQYRAVGYQSVSGPHSRCTKYAVAQHPNGFSVYGGSNAMLLKNKSSYSNGDIFYIRWYQRCGPNWLYGDNDLDANFKYFAYNGDTGPYNLPYNWYAAFNPATFQTGNETPQHLVNDDAIDSFRSLSSPDQNGNDLYWNGGANIKLQWALIEVVIKVTNATSGYIKVYEDGVLNINYAGPTDKYPNSGSLRSVGIGGYSGTYEISTGNQYRFFADMYVDWTPQRVILSTSSTDFAGGEVQIPTSWSTTQIDFTVNLGKYTTPGTPAWLHVIGPTGNRIGNAKSVTIGN